MRTVMIKPNAHGWPSVGFMMVALLCGCVPPGQILPFGTSAVIWGSDAEGRAEVSVPAFGVGLAVGDVSDDGIADLLVGAPDSGIADRLRAGDVYLLTGPFSGFRQLEDEPAALALRGQTPMRRYGGVLALADMSGDGVVDLIVASSASSTPDAHSPGFDPAGGTVLAIDGGLRGDHPLEASSFLTIRGPASLGVAVAAGDYDGDGWDDLVISCPLRAEVYVVRGPRHGEVLLPEEADVRFHLAEGSLGRRIAVGDVDADGRIDLLMDASVQGRVYLLPGGLTGEQDVEAVAKAVFVGDPDQVLVGKALAMGDLTGDGQDDFVIVDQIADDPERTQVHVVAGPVSGSLVLGQADLLTLTDLMSRVTAASVAVVGPIGGFERALVIGAYLSRTNGLVGGAVWAVDGNLTGRMSADEARHTFRARRLTARDLGINGVGFAIGVADTDGDGDADVLTTAPAARTGDRVLGAVVVFPGG